MTTTALRTILARVRRPRRRPGEPALLSGLLLTAGVLAVAAVIWPADMRGAVVLSVPVLLGGLLLHRLLEMWLLIGATLALLGIVVLSVPDSSQSVTAGSALLLAVVTAVSHEQVRRRHRLGVREGRPDMILAELRERLRLQGEVPALPPGWQVETELRSAHDAGMAGDFLVSRLESDGQGGYHLDLVLVDVSGKGVAAGARALLLSGAFGGLLGAVPRNRFLIEANRYLVRQHWGEGFATAVHLQLNLDTGEYRIETAGHPPAAHLVAGAGRWRLAQSRGPLLGVLAEVRYVPDVGTLRPGDALLLYTDGVVEDRSRDVDLGLDRLLGAAETLIPGGDFTGAAGYLVERVPARSDDDRAVVLLWREHR
ncbi:MAG TPA: PP2C family protein-serine/threonine phosphatase [Mycobacteriales bacterium]|nr:PP2C family protein-serine/threonine phosphatase [Mycobacteriales bacterium]